MGDLISRQAAIDDVLNMKVEHRVSWKDAVIDMLDALPSTQQEPQWIPCSEKLPKEKDGRVLITLEDEVTTAIYSEFSKTWYIGDMCGVSDRIPTAWMPRPKPYRSK